MLLLYVGYLIAWYCRFFWNDLTHFAVNATKLENYR